MAFRNGGDEHVIEIRPDSQEKRGRRESRYDPPNADVVIDNEIYPHDIDRFKATSAAADAPQFKSRDPSCERERPLVNLVRPTPVSSPAPTPSSGQEGRRTEESRQAVSPHPHERKKKGNSEAISTRPKESTSSNQLPGDVVIRLKEDTTQPSPSSKFVSWGESSTRKREDTTQPSPSSKFVSWGENSTQSYEVETPEAGDGAEGPSELAGAEERS
ncbi:involucrin repeat [Trichoderma cornu-damae]|uniref:Involucrin repeat n=1 Tax=Trichoderma cornu-damae TaxID=654480 RepID=A0A9P8QM16_9HYPO|nr:involucrin repeat [Trichoderma cornu-damae]